MSGDVSVIIPNWNGAPVLAAALDALARQSVQPAAVLVVDNGSTDRSVEIARDAGALVLCLETNQGFCRAVNEGIRRCGTPWVAILNNDVEIAPDWLEQLLSRAEPEHWFLAPRILQHGSPGCLDGTFDLVSRSACAWRAGNGRPDGAHWRDEEPIAFPSFTAGLFRRELFDRAGLLDERFGSYLEDVDFGFRCALSGFGGLYVPAAAAWHRGGATLGSWSGAMVRLLSRNQVFLVARHYPSDWVERYGAQVLIGQLLWGMLSLRRGVFLPWLRGKLEGILRFRELRGPVVEASAARFHEILSCSERRILTLQRRDGFDWFWRTYFRFCGEGV